ncbi:type II toxin-antitoxin system antitoxin SocA domain-containing protein [Acinetobacter sp. ANC 7454]|uniref:Panacea domain-containing protein n=1 Tax=Acinetobacter thermotolerans TaxID=3151487 RepID=UPI00325BF9DA
MAHTALQVANRIIELGRSKTPAQHYTPMQLLKLVYIAHGWMLGICSTPLITEQVEAWKYGPVIPDLYQHVKKYGANPIFDEKLGNFFQNMQSSEFTNDENSILNFVVDTYGNIDGIRLSQITHAADTPWSNTFKNGWGDVIPTDLIAHHYRQLLEKVRSNAGTTA